jgi:hypothetical protein
MKKLFPIVSLLSLLLILPAGAQKRILVSPYGDAFPIGKGQGAAEIMKQAVMKQTASRTMVCSDKATFGYSIDNYPNPETNHIGFHQDIMAMWYVAPASGTIDTIFWRAADVGSFDSTITLRLFESNIYPGSGPGYNGYPAPAQTNCWGYFISTNDHNGVAPFPEDATDPTWQSTVSGGNPSFSPMGNEIWGFGGFPVQEHANSVNSISLDVLGNPSITVGDPFFITLRIYGPHVPQSEENQTGFLATNETNPLSTHNWKFYEHVATIQPGFTCKGWVARGAFNILTWYSMTVTTNIPPTFGNVTSVNNTLSTAAQTVQASIVDCDPGNAAAAGVENAALRFTLNGAAQPDVPMIYIGGDMWEADLPAADVDDAIAYKIVAEDSSGFADSSTTGAYKIVALSTAWYAADTGATCAPQDISATGTTIDTAAFFNPHNTGSGTSPKDDGTAGPFDLGANFTLFGDAFRYAWIGVNGGLALSKTGVDTLDVNANGYATTFWDFPDAPQRNGRGDTVNTSGIPGMFIAPFWADHIIGDAAAKYGNIRYGNNGNPCLFIAEWDSVGAFDDLGSTPDFTTFRAVLNRCDGTIEFQYKSVGSTGLDSLALVGMQADSNEVSGPRPGWIYVNRNTYPYESKPRDSWCVRFTPKISTLALDGWNIVGVSLTPNDANYAKDNLFPTAVSAAFAYDNGYKPVPTLEQGQGVWLKFSGSGGVGNAPGTFDNDVTATVKDNWNLICGPSAFVPVGTIIPGGGSSVVSSYFGYGETGYYTATSLQPGKGVWVKVSNAGTLQMIGSSAAPKTVEMPVELLTAGKITVNDAAGRSTSLYIGVVSSGRDPGFFELPPAPPAGAFDIRFASGRMLEALPSVDDETVARYPIQIQGVTYPITVSWDLTPIPTAGTKLLISTGSERSSATPIAGSGSVVFRDARSAAGLSITASGSAHGLPAEFALGRNFPNPFNPSTSMQVDIPTASEVDVAVYDLLGRLVSRLMSGPQPAGSVTITWDGRDNAGMQVPTGMYIVRMAAGDFSASQKVLMMK